MTRARPLAIASAATLAFAVSTAAPAPSAQIPTFRARTDVVSVPVTVMRGRQPVTGLTAADFEVTDNGVRQTIDAVSSDEVPIDVTLVLTEFPIGMIPEHLDAILSADAVHRFLRPTDRVRLVTVEDHVIGRDLPPGFDLREDPIVRGLTRGRGTATGFVVYRNEIGPDERHGVGLALADGLFYSLAWPVAPDRRHLIVAITDGFDTASTLELARLPGLASRSDAVLHGVFWTTPRDGPGQAGGRWTSGGANLPQWEASFRVIDQTIQQTGGSLHRVGRGESALAEIIAAFRASYILRYTPRGVSTPGWHDLKVKVTRPGSMTIRARRGYEGTR